MIFKPLLVWSFKLRNSGWQCQLKAKGYHTWVHLNYSQAFLMVFIWPVMLSHQTAFTQVLILSPCFTHLLLLVPHPSHCAAVSLSDVWELSFILRAVINACKWICGAVFSHKLWLKGCLKQFTGYILVQGNHCKAALHDYAVDTQKATRTGI